MQKLADISAFERLQHQAHTSFVTDVAVFNLFYNADPVYKQIFEALKTRKERRYADKEWPVTDIAEEAGKLLGMGLAYKENEFKDKSHADLYKSVKFGADDIMHGLYESGLLDHDDSALLRNGELQRIIRRAALEWLGEHLSNI